MVILLKFIISTFGWIINLVNIRIITIGMLTNSVTFERLLFKLQAESECLGSLEASLALFYFI